MATFLGVTREAVWQARKLGILLTICVGLDVQSGLYEGKYGTVLRITDDELDSWRRWRLICHLRRCSFFVALWILLARMFEVVE